MERTDNGFVTDNMTEADKEFLSAYAESKIVSEIATIRNLILSADINNLPSREALCSQLRVDEDTLQRMMTIAADCSSDAEGKQEICKKLAIINQDKLGDIVIGLRAENKALRAQLNEALEKSKQTDFEIEGLRAALSNTDDELNELKPLEAQISQLNEERAGLQTQLEQLKEENNNLKERSLNVDSSEYERLQAQVKQLEDAISQHENTISYLKEELSNARNNNANNGTHNREDLDLEEAEKKDDDENWGEEEVAKEKAPKKKIKKIYFLYAAIVAFVAFAIFNVVRNQPTAIPVNGLPTTVSDKNISVQAPLEANTTTAQALQPNAVTTPVNGAPTEVVLNPTHTQTPVGNSKISTVEDVKAAASSFTASEGYFVHQGKQYKVGESFYGFKILDAKKTFVRFQDSKDGFSFRADVSGGGQ